MKTKLFLIVLAAVPLHFAVAAFAGDDYVAHEWGTFTSVQGADGVQLEWNPLTVSELPKFVYDASKPAGDPRRRLRLFASKTGLRTLQRMETPVIYFYSNRERTVDVEVTFPEGRVTEWYPQVREIGPSAMVSRPLLAKAGELASQTGIPGVNLSALDTKKGIAESVIRWTDVKVLPAASQYQLKDLLPVDQSGSPYYAARETDADFLRVGNETEKFLFYRGVGDFHAPLTVMQSGSDADSITVQNTGGDELRHIIVYCVRGGRAKFRSLGHLAPGKSSSLDFKPDQNLRPLSEARVDILNRMAIALAGEGLYEREAAAMVKTWDDSWFGEPGIRVFYLLPRAWTDRVLPLKFSPAPKEVARVMVGRAELLTPQMEWNLMKGIVRYIDADEAGKAKAVEEARALGLGRFMEPATRRLMSKLSSPELARYSWELLQAAAKPATEEKKFAAN
jgi:hypothetical protein